MAEQKNEGFLKGLEERTARFTCEDFSRFERIMERGGCAVARAIAAPIGTASAQPTNTGMFISFTMPELRGREHGGILLKRF